MKLGRLLYRLTMPGGVILILAYVLLRLEIVPGRVSPRIDLYALFILGMALVLGAAFHRSRLFLASLILALAQAALAWFSPRVSPESQHLLLNAIALLVPLNLLALAWLWDRGIVSPAGRRRLIFIGVEILVVATLMLPRFAHVAAAFDRPFVSQRFSQWSRVPQLALAGFVLAALLLTISLARRYRAVESSFLWSLVATFIALRAGGFGYRSAVYFAAAGVLLMLAVLETSYRMAYHDELTRLPSRRALNEALLKLGDSYTLAMVDVDHFKKFNDTYGHDSGDQALKMVASRLAHVTGGGKAYRYGGEEFAILFPDKPVEEAFTYLDRMRRLIEQSPFMVRGPDRRRTRRKKQKAGGKTETSVTVSVGIAASQRNEFTVEEVLRAADQALYKAKNRGRNCTVIGKPAKSAKSAGLKVKILQVS
jgi:diguanylate cyclase (GGDEF)-like protein